MPQEIAHILLLFHFKILLKLNALKIPVFLYKYTHKKIFKNVRLVPEAIAAPIPPKGGIKIT